jgi:hypothetical protein
MTLVVHQEPRRGRPCSCRQGVGSRLDNVPRSLGVGRQLVERPGSHERIEAKVGRDSDLRVRADRCRNPASRKRRPTSRRRVVMAEAVWASDSGEQSVELGGATPSPPSRAAKVNGLRCSFCQARLDTENESMPAGAGAHGRRMSASRFCSTRCRDCVLALEALNPSPLASYDFITRRALLTDRLIDLWRSGRGPDPTLVLRAARTSNSGLATPAASD